jgi:hypothetical protein
VIALIKNLFFDSDQNFAVLGCHTVLKHVQYSSS